MLKVTLKPHRAALKAADSSPQKLFAMLKMIPAPELQAARGQLAIALVIDTSGSMREFADQQRAREEISRRGLIGQAVDMGDGGGQGFDLPQDTKLDQAIAAAHKLVDDPRLLPNDRVTLIHFDTEARVLLPLTPLDQRHLLHQAIEGLRECSGETFMAKGMACAQQQLADLPPQTVKRVVLLTDGATRQEGTCRRLAGQFAETNTPIIAIGIGPEYNEKLMLELAQISQGRPYHLQRMEQLHEILDNEVGSSVREVITNLEATIAAVKGVSITSVARVYPSLSEAVLDHQPYRLGNIAAGDYTVFIVEFTVQGLARPPSRVRVAQIALSGSLAGSTLAQELFREDLFVTFTTDEASIAAVDPEVLGYVQQKNIDNLLQKAMGEATRNAAQARQTLQVALGMTQRIGNAAMTRVLHNALEELNKTGSISPETRKTVALGGRTRTIKTGEGGLPTDLPSEEQIRKITGL